MPWRALALLLLLAATAAAKPNRGPFKKIAVIHLREDTSEMIDASVKTSVLRRLDDARAWGADCVILDVQSYGGLVTASQETGDEIFVVGRDVHTIAYVGRRAISGAAMLSMACQEIVLNEVANIGDSQVVGMDGTTAPEKYQTVVATKFQTYAEGNGYPVPLAIAMVRAEAEVTRYKRPRVPGGPADDFEWVYYRTDGMHGPSRREIEEQRLFDPETVVPEGQLATYSAKQAVEYGIASRLEPTLDTLLESIKAPGAEVRTFTWNWAENTSRFLLSISWLLFLLGAGSLYFALKMPGTGIPEVLAIVCFGLFFGASAVAGLAGALEVILFFVGVALLVVEIFILPGFGVAGFLGLGAILVSIAMAAIPETGDFPDAPTVFILPMAAKFLIGTIGAMLGVFFIARHLPSVPFFNRLALAPAARQSGGALMGEAPAARHQLVGAQGVAETQLRPAGVARIDAQRRDGVADGGFVDVGATVRVVEVRGNSVIVREVSAPAS